MSERPHSRIMLIKKQDPNMSFAYWINFIHRRFQTRQWRSSLDKNALILHLDKRRIPNGIIIEVPFLIGDETFVEKMGTEAMRTILSWNIWEIDDDLKSKFSDRIPDEMFWVLIKDQNIQYDQWLNQLQDHFKRNNWENNINTGHKVISDPDGERVGVYVKMPFPMSFSRFEEKIMLDCRDTIRYVTKTTHEMTVEELNNCFREGLFVRL